jgi:hypothetical protein
MAPRTKPEVPLVRLSPEEQAKLREGFAALDRGDYVELTPEEVEHLLETDELPEDRIAEWLAARHG